ncbi:hypothetical protein [Caproicibacter sp. BJN0012]|uniref:hypothetical protein n=1 Tax=Caproicibacter sp. BJN0012 TaxID=3110227 RepID=UPI002E109CC0
MTCKIIVDSCCDMTPQIRKRLDVTLIPLTMNLGKQINIWAIRSIRQMDETSSNHNGGVTL